MLSVPIDVSIATLQALRILMSLQRVFQRYYINYFLTSRRLPQAKTWRRHTRGKLERKNKADFCT